MRRRVKGASETLAVQVADAVSRMRDSDVQKPPGIAEAIDWLAALEPARRRGARRRRDRPHARVGAQVRRGPGGRARRRPRAAGAAGDDGPTSASRRSTLDLPPLAAAFAPAAARAGRAGHARRAGRASRGRSALTRPVSRRRLYWTARSVFVSDQAQVAAFDRVFARRLRRRRRCGRSRRGRRSPRRRTTGRRPTDAAAPERPIGRGPVPPPPARATTRTTRARGAGRARQRRGAARGKRFDALEPGELAQLYRLMSQLELATPLRRTRRQERGPPRRATSTCAAPCAPACAPAASRSRWRAGGGASSRRRLVMLCDISGSMEPYARAYLQFLVCAAGSGPHVEAFVFATRLTRLTRALAGRNPERALRAPPRRRPTGRAAPGSATR